MESERSPLSGRRYSLSKSKLMAFEQCAKRLWLQVHKPAEAEINAATQVRFAAGHEFGVRARLLVPDGILVEEGPGHVDEALCTTAMLLARVPVRPLFEAAFKREDVIVRADIISPVDPLGTAWDLIEVKNCRQPRATHISDIATQAWVIAPFLRLESLIIRHVVTPLLTPNSRRSLQFRDYEATAAAAKYYNTRSAVASAARETLRAPEPNIRPGQHCEQPYHCEFARYCGAHSCEAADLPVTRIKKAKRNALSV